MWYNCVDTVWTLHDLLAHVFELFRFVGISNIYTMRISSELNSFHPYALALHPGRRVGFYYENEKKETSHTK